MRFQRKNRSTFLFLFLVIFLNPLYSQLPINQIGGKANGVSGTSVTSKDIWAQYHNQAGLASLKNISVGCAYQNAYFVKELSTKSIALVVPIKLGVLGLNYYYFGYPKFNENKIGLSFAKKLGKRFALGGQVDYLYTHIDGDYGQKGIAAGELGLIAEPLDQFFIGAHVFNIWHSKLSEYEIEYLPTLFRLGASYLFYKKVLLGVELEKDLVEEVRFKTGIELELVKDFYFRAGIATMPSTYSFGLGYSFMQITVNLAFSKHPILDYSPSLSIIYTIKSI